MNDLISRQAAIDALRYAQHRFTVADEAGGMGTVKWSEDVIYFAAAERVLTELPSAQPEHDENELDFVQPHKRIPVQLVVSSDCISRQAAIDEIKALYEWHDTVTEDRTIDHLKRLPSAQPDLDEVYAHAETEAEFRHHAEIVRCKDCVYAADDDYHHCSYVTWWNGENDFCSKGKRKTDEQAD